MKTLRRSSLCAIALATFLLLVASLHADFVFFKDGFVVQGKILTEYETITDPSGTLVSIRKLGGLYLVDDGARRIHFPASLVASSDGTDRKSKNEQFDFKHRNMQWHPSNPSLKAFDVKKIGEWQADGTRSEIVTSRSASTPIEIDQVIHRLTPTTMEVQTRRYTGSRHQYLTSEFDPEKVLTILRAKLKTDASEAKRDVSFDDKLRIVYFAAQAGWHDLALKEANAIAKDFPTKLDQLKQITEDIKKSQLKQKLEEIDDAIASGQHSLAQSLLASTEQENADAQDLTKLSTLRNKYKNQNADLERARKLLGQARQKASGNLATQGGPILEEIDRDLSLDNLASLNVFLKMAEQEERLRTRQQPPSLSSDQLLALALTGWMLGSEGADSKVENAEKLLRGREFLQQFLVEDNDGLRQQMLRDFLAKTSLKADEVTQLIDQLPPPRAEAVKKPVLDLVTKTTKLWSNGVKYRVFLPPEYHHYRNYPVLLLIPNIGDTYESASQGWLEMAARKGFIVAIPEWIEGKQDIYNSTDKEQEAVLETLRDLRRRFRIDNNRVCLAGYSNGGNVVFDVAMTRPHLFAGAAVICGVAPPEMEKLRFNAQYLPFYVVDGSKNPYRDRMGSAKKDVLTVMFETWIMKGYPSLFVEYQGRGFEQYNAEKPIIIDWMSRKKRAAAMPELGKADMSGNRLGQEFRIVRPSATRFYWLEASEHQATPQAPVLVSGGWEKEYPNSLRCVMTGMKKVRVWLNASMVSFENPVEIRIQGPPGSVFQSNFKKKLEPNVGVLLEDYYQRGDSKNLFVQYVDFSFSR